MTTPRSLVPLSAGLALLCLAVPADIVSAQDTKHGAVTGVVYDLRTGIAVNGMTVTIDGTRLTATTNEKGEFRIEGIEPGERILRVGGDGYTSVIENVVIDAGWTAGVDIRMAPMVAMLEALSVEVGIGSIMEDSLTQSSQLRKADEDANMFQSLSRVPGVQVSWPGGVVGRGARIQIRGRSSITLSNNPTFYLDGIRMGPREPQFDLGAGTTYYDLDFVTPQEIDRIDVMRGPATGFRFGGDAAAGVIMIWTKHGG